MVFNDAGGRKLQARLVPKDEYGDAFFCVGPLGCDETEEIMLTEDNLRMLLADMQPSINKGDTHGTRS